MSCVRHVHLSVGENREELGRRCIACVGGNEWDTYSVAHTFFTHSSFWLPYWLPPLDTHKAARRVGDSG